MTRPAGPIAALASVQPADLLPLLSARAAQWAPGLRRSTAPEKREAT